MHRIQESSWLQSRESKGANHRNNQFDSANDNNDTCTQLNNIRINAIAITPMAGKQHQIIISIIIITTNETTTTRKLPK